MYSQILALFIILPLLGPILAASLPSESISKRLAVDSSFTAAQYAASVPAAILYCGQVARLASQRAGSNDASKCGADFISTQRH